MRMDASKLARRPAFTLAHVLAPALAHALARFLVPAVALAFVFIADGRAAPAASAEKVWAAAWTASPVATDPDPDDPLLNIDGQTVRQRVRLSIGGAQLRVQLSNEHGATALTVGSATVALPSDVASVRRESLRPLTFGGKRSVTIPAGAPILSDAVDLVVPPGGEISISLYFPQRVATPTVHALALKRAIITPRGDFTSADRVEKQAATESSILVSAVLVPARRGQRVVVAFGDSITDGDASTVDADRNWPNGLARRLGQRAAGGGVAVVNAGIAGNRLLADGPGISVLGRSGLSRFERDVLKVPGVTHVIVLEGLNDLGFPGATLHDYPLAPATQTRTAQDLIGAYKQLIARAHAQGLKVIGATLTPFEGADVPGYYSDSKEAVRQAVNTWIRTPGNYDAVIDFDAVLRDPGHPSRMQARFASPDHLHPNDAGYQAMADAVDLSLFQ